MPPIQRAQSRQHAHRSTRNEPTGPRAAAAGAPSKPRAAAAGAPSKSRAADGPRTETTPRGPKGSRGQRSYGAGNGPARGPKRGPRPAGRSSRSTVVPVLTGPSGFTELGVPDVFAAVLQAQGITDPYPIQRATIHDAIAGRDVLGRGRTGSGKTLAFGLPMVTRLAKPGTVLTSRRSPRGLVLVPTRELAAQVMEVLVPLCDPVGLEVCLVIGGASYDKQIARLHKGTDIIVATPGRLYDLTERAAADLSHISTVVIDEADQMADLGFLPQVEVLLDQVPKNGQRLLFSATLDSGVDALVAHYLHEPREHATDPDSAAVGTMQHRVVVVSHANKQEHAASIARESTRTIVFVRTRAAVETFHEQFGTLGLSTDMIHGGMTQRARTRAMDGFKRGTTRVLIATDVAARGIHVDDVSVVLQYDIPTDHKDYLHRAGRTARAGARGTVVTLVSPNQQRGFARLLDRAGVTPEVEYVPARTGGRRPERSHRQR